MISLYIVAKLSNTDIAFWELLKLKFQGIDTRLFVHSMVMLKKANIIIPKEEIVSLIKNKQDVKNIVNSLLLSKNKNFELTFDEAIRGDKMGINFTEELNSAKDIQVKIKEIRNRIFLNS